MDTAQRTLCKAITWQSMGLVVTCLLGYIATGSFQFAGGFALGLAALSLVTYFLHERLWAMVSWGRAPTLRKGASEGGEHRLRG